MTILHKFGLVLGTLFLTVGGWLNPAPASAPATPPAVIQELPQVSLGTAIPKVIAVFTTSLQSAISTSDTSMTLVSGTDKAGNAISGYTCFNIDEGSVSEEFVCGTASSTLVTGMIRGVDPVNGSLSVVSLKKAHRRGAIVKITNYPVEGILARILNGTDQIPNPVQYDSGVTNALIAANGYNLVDVNYVASTSFSGTVASNPSSGIAGIGMFSTQSQLAAGTPTSSYLGTTYSLFPWNSFFNSTSTATTTAVVTKTNGKISQGFLDLTEAFNISGTTTLSNVASISVSTATSTATSTDVFNLIPAGVVQIYSSSSAPAGWLLADGSSYSTSTYRRLFTVIGYTYGGSGNSFKVPDLRGRFPLGVSTTAPYAILGNTGGNATTTVGPLNIPTTSNTANGGNTGPTTGQTGTQDINIMNPYLVLNYIIKY